MPGTKTRPEKLGAKLRAVREKFGYSFGEMAEKLSDDELWIHRHYVQRYETGHSEPSTLILFRYAKLARVKMEIFADDERDLPW